MYMHVHDGRSSVIENRPQLLMGEFLLVFIIPAGPGENDFPYGPRNCMSMYKLHVFACSYRCVPEIDETIN